MKRVTDILMLLMFASVAYGQTEQKSEQVEVYFDHNDCAIDLDFMQNRVSLDNLSKLISSLQDDPQTSISKIEINSYSSPEGGRSFNKKLAEQRATSLYDYLVESTSVDESALVKQSHGTDWDGLHMVVEESSMQYRDEVLEILESVPEETWERVKPSDKWLTMTDSRNKHLMELQGGVPYIYMLENMYPHLRRGSVVTIYFETVVQPDPVVEPTPEPEPIVEEQPQIVEEPKEEPMVDPTASESAPVAPLAPKPLFALKTNLLFDVASLINVELEVPIGNRWSVAGEWIFPWWTSCGSKSNSWSSSKNSSRNTVELLNGNIEGRYWFGDRENTPVLTGWNVGLYAGALVSTKNSEKFFEVFEI